MSESTEWAAVVTQMRADLANGVNVQSMTVAGESYMFRSLTEQRKFLEYAEGKAAAAAGGGGMFSLGRLTGL